MDPPYYPLLHPPLGKETAPGDVEPLSNSNCTQYLSLSVCCKPLPLGPRVQSLGPDSLVKKTSDDEPLSNSNCAQCLSLAACIQPLPLDPDPLEKNAPSDDKPLSNSNCLERMCEFQLKMHRGWGGGPFALCINIPYLPFTTKVASDEDALV